jgi:two-component system NtrC family sensor kinase
MRAALPADEPERLDALRRLGVLDTDEEEAFNDIAHLAAYICHAPTALVTFVDSDRQWFKARVGFSPRETSRDVSFCAHAILQPGPLVVRDTFDDERFRDNPLVTETPYIRFYAGSPLTSSEGFKLGTLCVIDRVPRELRPEQLDALRRLGNQVMALLNLRHDVVYLARSLKERNRRVDELEDLLRPHGEQPAG